MTPADSNPSSAARPAILTLARPDDWHLHLRDGPAMASVVGFTARAFARAIVMPNLVPPVATVREARAYRDRIRAALAEGAAFDPLPALYLTARTTPEDVAEARASGFVPAIKHYPAGATTHSDAGVPTLSSVSPVLAAMERHGLVLCVHGEVVDAAVDTFDRERVFVERELARTVQDFPGLRIVVEHITTREAVDFVRAAPANVAATITPQHLLYSRDAMFAGGVRPHLFCRPVLKREAHRRAVLEAAISGEPKFFLGTDSAPHSRRAKENACGCAGCFSAHAALEMYAEVFEAAGALDRLEAFASHHGADFYGLPRNRDTLTLRREAWTVPAAYPFGDETLVPLKAGETLAWRLDA